jgi:PIN domain nuclease of toxin-antitoxin system
MKVLLDTCTFLWVLSADPRLSPRAADMFRGADHEIFLSAASAWEIAVKYSAGKLELPERPDRFVPVIREERGIVSLPIDEESALHASRLALVHRDPFDRLLVGQAIVHGMTILTPDPIISQYPARTMW